MPSGTEVRLADLHACFEGVIPSILATAAVDGTPNVSYLSHVVMVDERHVGLSNQFFSKTAENIRANPQATLLLVDARSGDQYRLALTFVEALASGPVFERVGSQLQATSAQVGMAGVFRLKAVDVYRVDELLEAPSPVVSTLSAGQAPAATLELAAEIVQAIARQADFDGIVESVLDGIAAGFGHDSTMLLIHDPGRDVLTTIGSRGYAHSGIGAEVPLRDGIIGAAAADRHPFKVSDMSRIRRFGEAIRNSSADENRTRSVALPGIAEPMSQIAVPMIAQGLLQGVLFAESRQRLAFSGNDEAALAVIASQTAAALLLAEHAAAEQAAAPGPTAAAGVPGREFRVTHHAYDDSVFIDNEYVIKGVSGRLLMFMLETCRRDGRQEFSNRELRLTSALRLPDIKDNLESRLLLLRRRLDEKALPARIVRTGRGRISLRLDGVPIIEQAT
jgi:adenylate cyclase